MSLGTAKGQEINDVPGRVYSMSAPLLPDRSHRTVTTNSPRKGGQGKTTVGRLGAHDLHIFLALSYIFTSD
jgi:hypothetical protein